jgi:hypothetical protein
MLKLHREMIRFAGSQAPAWEPNSCKLLLDSYWEAGASKTAYPSRSLGTRKSVADYERATVLLNSIPEILGYERNQPLYSLVSVVGDLIETYESVNPVKLDAKNGI